MANPVERATITPRYVNPPREGKKSGQAKLGADQFNITRDFLVRPDLVPLMRNGQTYDVEYESRDFQGTTYRTITRVTPHQQASGNGAAPGVNNIPPKTWQPQQKSLQEQAMIAACGIVNHAVAAGILVLDEDSITEAFNAALNGFYNSKAALPYHGQVKAQPPAQSATKKPTAAEEMDDQIPF